MGRLPKDDKQEQFIKMEKKEKKKTALQEMPTEKMERMPVSRLKHEEIIAVLLGTGTKNERATDMASRLMERTKNSIYDLSLMSYRQMRMNGLGEKKAKRIICAFEIGRRREEERKKREETQKKQ